MPRQENGELRAIRGSWRRSWFGDIGCDGTTKATAPSGHSPPTASSFPLRAQSPTPLGCPPPSQRIDPRANQHGSPISGTVRARMRPSTLPGLAPRAPRRARQLPCGGRRRRHDMADASQRLAARGAHAPRFVFPAQPVDLAFTRLARCTTSEAPTAAVPCTGRRGLWPNGALGIPRSRARRACGTMQPTTPDIEETAMYLLRSSKVELGPALSGLGRPSALPPHGAGRRVGPPSVFVGSPAHDATAA